MQQQNLMQQQNRYHGNPTAVGRHRWTPVLDGYRLTSSFACKQEPGFWMNRENRVFILL